MSGIEGRFGKCAYLVGFLLPAMLRLALSVATALLQVLMVVCGLVVVVLALRWYQHPEIGHRERYGLVMALLAGTGLLCGLVQHRLLRLL